MQQLIFVLSRLISEHLMLTALLTVAKIWCFKLRAIFFWNTLYQMCLGTVSYKICRACFVVLVPCMSICTHSAHFTIIIIYHKFMVYWLLFLV